MRIEIKRLFRQLQRTLLRGDLSNQQKRLLDYHYAHFCNLCSYEFEFGEPDKQVTLMQMRNEIDTLYFSQVETQAS
jgi:hypothetical protein